MPATAPSRITPPKRAIIALTALLGAILAALPAQGLTLLAHESPPYTFTEKGSVQGSTTEIVRDMAGRGGVAVTVEVMPWDKAYVRTQAQKDVCLLATARLENRERLFLWVGPIATNPWAVFGKTDFALPIRTVKELAPYTIGTVLRDPKNEFLRENGVNDLRAARDDAQNPPRLLLPRENREHIDLWIAGLHAGREAARAAKVAGLRIVFIANEEPLYLACNPQTDRKIIKALSDALEGMKADGAFNRITAEYEKRFPR